MYKDDQLPSAEIIEKMRRELTPVRLTLTPNGTKSGNLSENKENLKSESTATQYESLVRECLELARTLTPCPLIELCDGITAIVVTIERIANEAHVENVQKSTLPDYRQVLSTLRRNALRAIPLAPTSTLGEWGVVVAVLFCLNSDQPVRRRT